MDNTRNHHNNNAENNNGGNNQDANPLPPPPPTLEQVLAVQAQMLQTMVNMQDAQTQAPPPSSWDRLRDFQRTKLLTFSHAVEPMDADDWLKSIEKKLHVVQYNNCQRVMLASHQLSSLAAD
jgi:hypothetical protein